MKTAVLKFMFVMMLSVSCTADKKQIDMFIMDYPHGEYRLHVKRTGEAYLYYGAGATAQVIRKDIFSAKAMHGIFKRHLHPILPRERWPNPKSQAGMITIRYAGGKEENYLIFDLQELTEEVFEKAKRNVIGKVF